QPGGFEKVTSQSGRFTVEMPGQPTDKVEKSDEGERHTFAVVAAGPKVYRVAYFDFPKEVAQKDPQTVIKAYRDGFRSGKTLDGDKIITLGPGKIPGREYSLEADKGV